MSKIIKLTVQNLLRIRAAEVTPDGALVVVSGRNDQGKSSLLNSIALALSGKDVPERPIRDGASNGHVILETEEITVTRRFSQSGGSTLEVRDRDGAKITSPQAKLDTLVSRVSFDPFAFTRLKPEEQARTIKTIAGLDFVALDAEHAAKYAERTGVGRQVKDAEGRFKAITRADAPTDEVSVIALSQQLREATAANGENAKQRGTLSAANDRVDEIAVEISRAGKVVETAKAALQEAELRVTTLGSERAEAATSRDQLKTALAELVDVDTSAILDSISAAEATNQKVRENKRWKQAHGEYVKHQNAYDALTARLSTIEKEKADALAAAKFPIEGLGFSATGVTFNSVPFEQASASGQLKVSLAIACALNPKLPVMLIRDGSLLDSDSMKVVEEMAAKHGAQVWIEVVSDDADGATCFIEDGTAYTPAQVASAAQ